MRRDRSPFSLATAPTTRPAAPSSGARFRSSLSRLALGERAERIVDPPVDLDALAREARALTIGALAGNADLEDAVLPRGCLDRGDLRRQRATILLQRNEQIRLERDEDVPGALPVRRASAEHAER